MAQQIRSLRQCIRPKPTWARIPEWRRSSGQCATRGTVAPHKAAEQDHVVVQATLGRLYEMGSKGVSDTDSDVVKDNGQAIRWYRKAAAAGSTEAINGLKRLE